MRARISTQIANALEGDLRTAGARLVRMALTNWDDSGSAVPFGTLLRWAATDEGATEAIENYVNAQVAAPLADALVKAGAGRDEARERAALAAGQVVGMAIIRYLFRLEPIASASVDHVVAVVGPSVQRYLTGPLAPRP